MNEISKPQNAIATAPKSEIRDWLQSDALKNQITQALPKICTPDRFMRVLFTSMQRVPKLMQCTKSSLLNAFITCSQMGIEPDGIRAHLIPYGSTCQLIIDYKGIVELALRSGKISNIHADVVCENDEFEYDMGEIKKHKPNFKGNRGEMYAVYSIARFKDGTSQSCVMTKAEVESIRKCSKAGNTGAWKDFYNEMAKKTAFKRLSKWLPLSPEVRDAIAKDDEVEFAPQVEVVPPAPKLFEAIEQPKVIDVDDEEFAEESEGDVND